MKNRFQLNDAFVRSLLLGLFVLSGVAALIYEIVWLQLLELIIGSSGVSLGVLLGTYMGGLSLGSLLLPRLATKKVHPIWIFAALEFGIACFGLALVFGMPYLSYVYVAASFEGWLGVFGRGLLAALCLLPPTLLMGASLPALSRCARGKAAADDKMDASWLGFLYAGNIAGAMFGCLFAGFYLLRVYDVVVATYVAAALNLFVAIAAVVFSSVIGSRLPQQKVEPSPRQRREAGDLRMLWIIGFSGFCALGAEVIWTRLLSLLLGPTVYTFSIILAVFLFGLGIGNGFGSWICREIKNARLALGLCQLLLVGAVFWAAWTIAAALPYWPIDPALSKSSWINFQVDLVRVSLAIFPAACLWGASFPFALTQDERMTLDPTRSVSRIYAANTIGAVLGSLAFSMLFIPMIGTQASQQLVLVLTAVSGLLCLSSLFGRSSSSVNAKLLHGAEKYGWAALIVIFGALILLVERLPKVPDGLVAYGRLLAKVKMNMPVLYSGEGMNASVAVSQQHDAVRVFHVSGKPEASTHPVDMRLQRLLGHLSALLHPEPKSVLIVGFGAGITAGTFVLYPGIERIVICEIEPLIPREVAGYFSAENYDVVADPRVKIVYDDARHYVLTSKEKFDIITSDPIHPWVKGAATLYSKEYFEAAQKRLNPGGVITQWVPLYESSVEVVRSEIATFFKVFPQGAAWGTFGKGKTYDVVLSNRVFAGAAAVKDFQARLRSAAYQPVQESLAQVGFQSPEKLLSTYWLSAEDLLPWYRDMAINTDRNLRLQYLAGLSLNADQTQAIISEILRYQKKPKH